MSRERFDEVVLATHADQALALLADPSEREREILGAIPYQRTRRCSTPTARCCRAGAPRGRAGTTTSSTSPTGLPTVTYRMNTLQRLTPAHELCVTLNRSEAIDPAKVLAPIPYAHPVFTAAGVAAQRRHAEI